MLCTHKWLSVCVMYIHIRGFVCVWHVYAQVCLHEDSVSCVHACMRRGSMCMFASTWCLCMSNGVHDGKGKVCAVFICHCRGQCVFVYVVCLHSSLWDSVCVLCASHVLCGAVHM